MSTDGLELDWGVPVPARWNGSMFPVESQDSMSAPALEIDRGGKVQQAGDGDRYEVCSKLRAAGHGEKPFPGLGSGKRRMRGR